MYNIKFPAWIIIFSIAYFLLGYYFALNWYSLGFFDVNDVFFNVDPKFNLDAFAHGYSQGKNSIRHALVEVLAAPVYFIEFIFSNLGFISNEQEFRELIALGISPFFSALTLIVFYKILIRLNIKTIDANIFMLMFALSASNIFFSVIPETFSISCFLISMLIYYYLWCKEVGNNSKPLVWLVLAFFLAGITITNLFIFFVIFSLHLLKNEEKKYLDVLKFSILYSISAIILVLFFYVASHFFLGYDVLIKSPIESNDNYLTTSFYQLAVNTIKLLSASINAVIALSPTTFPPADFYENLKFNRLSFSPYNTDFLWLGGVALFFMLFAFFSRKKIKEAQWEDLYLVSLPIIIFNLLFHMIYGREMFIYTQHWLIPLCLILIPMLSGKRLLAIFILCLMAVFNINLLLNAEQLVILNA